MTTLRPRFRLALPALATLAVLLPGCPAPKGGPSDTTAADPTGDDDGEEETTVGDDDDGDAETTADDGEDTVITSADTGEESSSGEDSNSGVSFIVPPDNPMGGFECDPWAQDCMEGEKCMPWANDGGSSWNATRCSPIDDNFVVIGDECQVEGSGVSGVDNCEIGSMCWNVDPETNMGVCVAFCSGSEANPICEDPGTSCNILNDGALILCLPNCDPLLQDCNEGEACYPTVDAFSCVPDAGGETGMFGDNCEYLNVCDPGLFCAVPDGVPECAGSIGCCSSFCDLTDPDATASCPGAAGGQECVAWYEDGQAPPGYEAVGACLIPA
jgi:hypothetical protein